MRLDEYQWESDFALKHQAIGRAQAVARGMGRALLAFLRVRGICVSDDVRERIMTCRDLDQLDLWVTRAATLQKVEELFD